MNEHQLEKTVLDILSESPQSAAMVIGNVATTPAYRQVPGRVVWRCICGLEDAGKIVRDLNVYRVA